MIRLCAWCKKDLDTGEQLTDAKYKELSKSASHGMCSECFRKEVVWKSKSSETN